MINKKVVMIIGIILLAVGATYAAGVVFLRGNSDGTVVTFTSGSQNWVVPNGVTAVEVLVVAGGGGGGSSSASSGGGGGGGAGGLRYFSSYSVIPGETINVTVGTGGAPGAAGANQDGSNGRNSSFGTIVTTGGGGGAMSYGGNGYPGGSGGGGGYNGYSVVRYGGSAVAGEGNAGGNTSLLAWAGGAGGGGAGGPGGPNKIDHWGGDGGLGLSYSINGTNITYSKGGGGGVNSPAESPANSGKGGDAAYATSTAYAGGSGVVIIKYKPMIQVSSIESGLVGHWVLDGDNYNSATNRMTDKTPYSNHGTNFGATLTTDRMGQSNGAMYFDGGDDYIDAGTNTIFSFSDNFTLNAWIKPSSISPANWGGVITKDDESGSTTHRNYWFGQKQSTDELCFFWHTSGGTAYGICTTNTDLTADNWFNIVAVVNGLNLNIYVNGINKTLNTVEYGPGNTNVVSFQIDNLVPVKIGRSNPVIHPFNGSIADVRIYNRALSENEIKTIYNSYKPKAASGSLQTGLIFDMPLTSDWTKTETAGSQIMTDRTPYSNDGQNYGAEVGPSSSAFVAANTDYILIPGTSVLDLQSLTISQWNYAPEYHGNMFMFEKTTNGAVNTQYSLFYNAGGSNTQIYFRTIGLSPSDLAVTDHANGPVDGQWNYLAATYDAVAHVKKIYCNGIEIASQSDITGTIDTNPVGTSFIGTYGGGEGYPFEGNISNTRVYNRALSSEEIKLLYDKGR